MPPGRTIPPPSARADRTDLSPLAADALDRIDSSAARLRTAAAALDDVVRDALADRKRTGLTRADVAARLGITTRQLDRHYSSSPVVTDPHSS